MTYDVHHSLIYICTNAKFKCQILDMYPDTLLRTDGKKDNAKITIINYNKSKQYAYNDTTFYSIIYHCVTYVQLKKQY